MIKWKKFQYDEKTEDYGFRFEFLNTINSNW